MSYYENEFSKHTNDIKKTWATINNIMHRNKKKSDFPSQIISNGKTLSNHSEIVNALNEYFSSIGPSLASKITNSEKNYSDYLNRTITSTFTFDAVNKKDVLKIIHQMKSKTSSGPDELSMKILKLMKEYIAEPLAILATQSLSTGIFPDKFKIAKVLPLQKKRNNCCIENYRPISLLNSMSKILEKCAFNQLYTYFEANDLFHESQYGYRKLHSTELACLELVDDISKQLDNKQIPLCVFLDLSKAFDTLDHNILLSKLKHYGLRNISLQWFSSYLSNRVQYIESDGIKSSPTIIKTGVPQGSILGPLLFIIYMNDINCASSIFKANLYADDTSLSSILSAFECDTANLSEKINTELDYISQWLLSNKLSLNTSKNEFILPCKLFALRSI